MHLSYAPRAPRLLNFVLVWIGITAVYMGTKCVSTVATVSFILSLAGRLGSVVIISLLYNLVANKENDIKFKDMFMLWTAGVRGPTALALVYEFPSSLREDFIGAALLSILVRPAPHRFMPLWCRGI